MGETSASADGSDIVFLTEADLDELLCGICHEIVVDPVTTQCCLQIFCRKCITNWLTQSPICPIDRKTLIVAELRLVPKAFTNLLETIRTRICPERMSSHQALTHQMEKQRTDTKRQKNSQTINKLKTELAHLRNDHQRALDRLKNDQAKALEQMRSSFVKDTIRKSMDEKLVQELADSKNIARFSVAAFIAFAVVSLIIILILKSQMESNPDKSFELDEFKRTYQMKNMLIEDLKYMLTESKEKLDLVQNIHRSSQLKLEKINEITHSLDQEVKQMNKVQYESIFQNQSSSWYFLKWIKFDVFNGLVILLVWCILFVWAKIIFSHRDA